MLWIESERGSFSRKIIARIRLLGGVDSPGDDPDDIKGLIVDNALYAMAGGIGSYGFEPASAWLDPLNLRPSEITRLLVEMQLKEDTGKWFEWMGDRLSSEDFELVAAQKLGTWVRDDIKTVEEWPARTADGPAKRAILSRYNSMIA
jgi:hypothetical protein